MLSKILSFNSETIFQDPREEADSTEKPHVDSEDTHMPYIYFLSFIYNFFVFSKRNFFFLKKMLDIIKYYKIKVAN